MSYSSGEALILAQVRNVSNFTATNTSRGNYQVLNTGKSRAAILHIEESDYTEERAGSGRPKHITVIEVWQRYGKDGTSYTNLMGDVEAIIARLQTYPHFGDTSGTIDLEKIGKAGRVEEMWNKGGGPAWLRSKIFVHWYQSVNLSYAE